MEDRVHTSHKSAIIAILSNRIHQKTTMNGDTVAARLSLLPGIYSPTMTFFDPETEDLDIPTIKRHAVRLAQAGLAGLVTMGTNGEAVHLSRAERTAVTKAT